MGDQFKDYFSGHANLYAIARPVYPPELFASLAELSPSHSYAWDCGTGNGQAANALAQYFSYVVGSDPSEAQIRQATSTPKTGYAVALAESSSLADRTIDLTVVAQALHWFDENKFYEEVKRVSKPGGLIAAWCYQLLRIDPVVDRYIDEYYTGTVGSYWPAERKHVDAGYRTLAFPFERVVVPSPSIETRWNLEQVVRYIETWSATRRYRNATGTNPVPPLVDKLVKVWESGEVRRVTWPLTVLAGRVA